MQDINQNKRHYRFVIDDIRVLHLKHTQHLTYENYPALTLREIVELCALYNERESYKEFKNDGEKFKLDLKELLENRNVDNQIKIL